jgi:hypothetical protein
MVFRINVCILLPPRIFFYSRNSRVIISDPLPPGYISVSEFPHQFIQRLQKGLLDYPISSHVGSHEEKKYILDLFSGLIIQRLAAQPAPAPPTTQRSLEKFMGHLPRVSG